MKWTMAGSWLGRRVLVTGASGFLGNAVSQVLLAAGAEVHGTGLSRLPAPELTAHPMRLPDDAHQLIVNLRPEVVIHLASPVDLRRHEVLYEALRPGILDGTVEVARACLATGARLLHVGTCEELAGAAVPFAPGIVSPTSPYSALKAAGSAWVSMLMATTELLATVVRPFRTFGPGEQRGLIPAACRAALAGAPFPMTDGRQVREWNEVEAVAQGIVALAAHPGAIGRTLNLGGGPKRSVREVVDLIFRLAEADPSLVQAGALPRRPGEVASFWGDHSDTEALIGQLPRLGLEPALRETLAWHAELTP